MSLSHSNRHAILFIVKTGFTAHIILHNGTCRHITLRNGSSLRMYNTSIILLQMCNKYKMKMLQGRCAAEILTK